MWRPNTFPEAYGTPTRSFSSPLLNFFGARYCMINQLREYVLQLGDLSPNATPQPHPICKPALTPHLLLHESSVDHIACTTASTDRRLIFTVFAGPQYAPWILQWASRLQAQGLLPFALIIGLSMADCAALRSALIPLRCVVHASRWRRAQPNIEEGLPSTLPPAHHPSRGRGRGRPQPADVKWYWAWLFVRHGYDVLYADADVAALGDWRNGWQGAWDFQGLSDTLRPQNTCYLGYGPHPACVSTGLMYLRASPVMNRSVEQFVQQLQAKPLLWEQRLWNTLLRRLQLTWRRLPDDIFANVGALEWQALNGHLAKPVALHLGYVRPKCKQLCFQCLGLWDPQISSAASLLTNKSCRVWLALRA